MDDFFDKTNSEEKTVENVNSQNKENDIRNGEYRYVPPRQSGSYQAPSQPQYQPPRQTPPAQPYVQNGYYYSPPQQQTPFQSVETNTFDSSVDEPVKKKKRKAPIIITIIVVICAVIAVAGIAIASNSNISSSLDSFKDDSSSSQSQQDDSASAKIEKSGNASKTDSNGNLTASGVAQKVIDSCVGITVYTEQDAYSYFYGYGQGSGDGSGKTASGSGSGVIMSESNGTTYIMTCAHVISDGSSFTVTLENGKEYDAQMVGFDSQTDIGVLSIKATGLQVAKFGDSDDIEVAEECIAIGCPAGLEFKNSVTKGIVSALSRPISSSIGYSNECIQVDAAINPGNSGGALFNMQGQVIGINSSKIASTEYEGMGFAVPSNTAVETANSLIKNGYVAGRAKLGIQYNSLENFTNSSAILSSLAEKGFKDAKGTMVIQSIDEKSDLSTKKLKQYDMIVAVNGDTMTSTDVMTSLLSKSNPGDTVTLTIARVQDNTIKTFEVKCKLIEDK